MTKTNKINITDEFEYSSSWSFNKQSPETDKRQNLSGVKNNKACVTSTFSNNAKLNSLSPEAKMDTDPSGMDNANLHAANDRCDTMFGSLLADQFLSLTFGLLLPFPLQSLNIAQMADMADQIWQDRTGSNDSAYSAQTSQHLPAMEAAHIHRNIADFSYRPAFC